MKVLIIHQHFKSPHVGGAIRSYYLAKALVEKGIEAVVITTHNEPAYRRACLEGIEVNYLRIPYDNRFSFKKRVFAFFRFAQQAVKLAARHQDAKLCYTISTPLTTGLAAIMIRRLYKIPYIFEVGDLWPDAPIEMGFIRNPVSRSLLFRLEKVIYRHAVSIVALSAPIRDAIERKISDRTIHVLPNMADTDFFRPAEKDCSLEERFGVKGKFVVSYIGAVGLANGLSYLLQCAAASQRAGLAVHFLVCGDGAMLDELKQQAKDALLSNVAFIPFQNRDGVAEIMNVTDAAFICYRRARILETGSPNKYFDGLAAGKLIVINFGGWIRQEIERELCGIYVDPEDATDFVEKIEGFMESEQLLRNYQLKARRVAEGKYSRKMLGERFCEIVIGSEWLRVEHGKTL